MRIDIISIFPKMFDPVLNESMIKRAQAKGKVKICLHNLRDYTRDLHKKTDDRTFGGGSGMVMGPEPIFRAVEFIKHRTLNTEHRTKVILLCPQGKRLTQKTARRLAKQKHLILICGHYEGKNWQMKRYPSAIMF
jgi:tRNA (guanine37-N1)-methyltransferase